MPSKKESPSKWIKGTHRLPPELAARFDKKVIGRNKNYIINKLIRRFVDEKP